MHRIASTINFIGVSKWPSSEPGPTPPFPQKITPESSAVFRHPSAILNSLTDLLRGKLNNYRLRHDMIKTDHWWLDENFLLKIAAQPNDATRNYAISTSYYHLSQELGQLMGFENANWLSFAVFASSEAGDVIKYKRLPPVLQKVPFIGQILKQAHDEIGRGNVKVFKEIAVLTARFVNLVQKNPTIDTQTLLQTLEIAEPKLQRALQLYHEAYQLQRQNKTAYKKIIAQKIFEANLLIGDHEQSKLQEQIERALPPQLRQLITQTIAKLDLPVEETPLYLHKDLSKPAYLDFENDFPEDLRGELPPGIAKILDEFGVNYDTTANSGAKDWTVFKQRMRYIANLFRMYQQHPEMFSAKYD